PGRRADPARGRSDSRRAPGAPCLVPHRIRPSGDRRPRAGPPPGAPGIRPRAVGRRVHRRLRAAPSRGLGVSRIFWDTSLFIHLFGGADGRTERVVSLRQRMLERQDELCTSALTLAEVLVKPVARGDEALRERYEQAFAQAVRLIPFDRDAARLYTEI